ncbi:MAG TPA: cytochrome c oxidase assembly protein [Steroidobacteraceae bacterium]|nr:cytochrome c oxidase assembly protein [Steroidobacteraceae bacterium]
MPWFLEPLLPWQFSPTVLVAVVVAAIAYRCGVTASHPRPTAGRRTAFHVGLLLIYTTLQTSWEYYAGHMFFVLRLQHFVLHDLAPALLAGAMPGAVLARGVPRQMQTPIRIMKRALRGPTRLLQNPGAAVTLYVAGLLIWLWPPLTDYVMVSNWLFKSMSWSVPATALPFWSLVLDPRPYPLARARPGPRLVMLYIAMLSMVLTSVSLTLAQRDWYPVYAVCGRFLPIAPVADQQLGGVIMWLFGSALYGVVFFMVLGRNLAQEEASAAAQHGT